jgi:hypothetical protein
MTTFIIKYYQNRDGDLIEVTPDIAHIFRVFQHIGQCMEWVHDYASLSLANEFIRTMRANELFLSSVPAGMEVLK